MDVLWVSPAGSGLLLAQRLRDSGNRVAVYPSDIDKPKLYDFMRNATLSVVDGPFPVERTSHGSWRPTPESLFIEEVRRYHKALAVGPTPTVDLLVGDRRYFRKWCGRLGLPYSASVPEGAESWSSGAWFRERDIVPDGPYLRLWQPLFKSVRFRGWFSLYGYVSPSGETPTVTSCSADWPAEAIPEGRETAFLTELVK